LAIGGQPRSRLLDIIKRLSLGREQSQTLVSSVDRPAVVGGRDQESCCYRLLSDKTSVHDCWSKSGSTRTAVAPVSSQRRDLVDGVTPCRRSSAPTRVMRGRTCQSRIWDWRPIPPRARPIGLCATRRARQEAYRAARMLRVSVGSARLAKKRHLNAATIGPRKKAS
jgi:hypothetical protein